MATTSIATGGGGLFRGTHPPPPLPPRLPREARVAHKSSSALKGPKVDKSEEVEDIGGGRAGRVVPGRAGGARRLSV